jgi:ribonuclease HII
VFSIAAASIVAKVTRDHLMMKYHQKFPGYGFDQNMGYGTEIHLKAILEHGPSPIHRMTFAPLKTIKAV